MALNSKVLMAKHQRFDSAAWYPLSVFANSLVEIYPQPNEGSTWGTGGVQRPEKKPLWRGWAAVTPNKAWRARNRQSGDQFGGEHAYTVQLRHIDDNHLLPVEERGDPAKRVRLGQDLIVEVVEHNSDPTRRGMRMVVRVCVTDSDWWQPTMACDMDPKDQALGYR